MYTNTAGLTSHSSLTTSKNLRDKTFLLYLNAEGDGQDVGEPRKSRNTNCHDNGHGCRLVCTDCLFTHVGTSIKASNGELGHQHANQENVPAKSIQYIQTVR